MTVLAERNGAATVGPGAVDPVTGVDRAAPYILASLSLVAWFALWLPVPTAVSAVSSALFWLAVPGGLWACHARWPAIVRYGTAPAIGVAILILMSSLQIWSGVWSPVLWTHLTMLSCMSLASTMAWRQGLPAGSAAGLWARRPVVVTWWNAALVGSLAVWVAGVPALRDATYAEFGLLAVPPYTLGLSIFLLILLFFFAVRAGRIASGTLALVGVAVVLRVTPLVATDAPLYSWTIKHIGVVDVITSTGSVPVGHDIYFSWPGMFAGSAWFVATTGLDPVTLAHWFTPAIHVVTMAAMAAVAGAFGLRGDRVLVAVFLAQILWWVGQDYFSPQSVAMSLSLAVIACAVQAASKRTPVTTAGLTKLGPTDLRATTGAVPWSLVLFASVVVTHQLTPFWLIAAIAALAFFGRAPGMAFWPMVIILAGYTWVNWDFVEQYGAVSSSSPLDNTQAATATEDPSSERALAQDVYRILAVSVWLPALIVGLLGFWKKRVWAFPGLAVGLSPFALIVVQTYGGEAILRVFLYSTAGMVVLLAPVFAGAWTTRTGATEHRQWRRRAVAVVALVAVIGWGSLASYAYFNTWFGNRVTAAQIQVTNTLVDDIPGPAYVSAGRGLWPHRGTQGYLVRADERWDFERQLWSVLPSPMPEPEDMDIAFDVLMERLETDDVPTYAMFADQSFAEARYDAADEFARLNALYDFIVQDPQWELVLVEGGVEVFRYVPPAAAGDPASVWVP